MFCSNCGKEVKNPGRFCEHCGAPLKQNPGPEPAGAEQPDGAQTDGGPASERAEKPSGGDKGVFAMALKIAALVAAALYVIYILPNIVDIFNGIFSILGGHPLFGVFYLIAALLLTAARAAMAAALVLFALCRDDGRNNTEPLLLTVISAGILRVLAAFVAPLLGGLGTWFRFRYFTYDIAGAGKSLLYVLIILGILAGLAVLAGLRPFAGKTKDEFLDEVKDLPNILNEEIERIKPEQKQTPENPGNMPETAGGPAPVKSTSGPRRISENRGLLKFYLIGIVTCGIYMLYTLHMLAKDINEMCEGDGETTAGLLKLIIFTVITCTVYNYIWHYKLMNRIQNNAQRYGIEVKTVGSMDLGACWVVLSVLGLLISWCGVGLILSLYADYLMFRNMNILSKAYNEQVVDKYQA